MTALGNAPAHWRRTTIGGIAEVRLGRQRSPKNHTGEFMQPYLRAANVTWYRLRLDDVAEMNFTEAEMRTYALREGDILAVEGGTPENVGQCALVTGDVAGHAFQNTLIRVRPRDEVDPRWLMYRLNADGELGGYKGIARGAGNIQHISSTRYAKHPIALPPLDEQREIVETIERMLSKLTAAAQTVQSGHARLQPFRRSALARAFGLGMDRDPSDVERLGWISTTIGEIADVRLGRQRSPENHVGEFMQPYLRAANVTWYRLRLDDVAEMNFTQDEMKTYALREGDILAVEGGTPENVGQCALVTKDVAGHAFQNTLIRVRAKEGIDPHWLMYRLNAEGELGGYRAIARGAGNIQHISATRYAKHRILVPPIDVQKRVVKEVEMAFSQLHHLSGMIAQVEGRTSGLRRSILKSAFEGRLIHKANHASLEDSEQIPA